MVYGSLVAGYELPLMDALVKDVPPHDFSLRVRVQSSAVAGNERVILVELALSEVELVASEAKGLFRAHVSLLGYVKDASGRLVARLTRDWPIEGALKDRERDRQEGAVFRLTRSFKAGDYQLEVAVQDRNGGGTSVARTSFAVRSGDD